MHIKHHIGKTKFLLVNNECCLALAIIRDSIQTDEVFEAKNISHCLFSEPNPKVVPRDLTFLGDMKSTSITLHVYHPFCVSPLVGKFRVATEVEGRLMIQKPHVLEVQIPRFMGLEGQGHF